MRTFLRPTSASSSTLSAVTSSTLCAGMPSLLLTLIYIQLDFAL